MTKGLKLTAVAAAIASFTMVPGSALAEEELKCKIKPEIECQQGDLKVKVGGRMQFDATWVDEDNLEQENGAEIRRARLEVSGESGITFGKVQVDFADNEVDLKDVYAGVKLFGGKAIFGNHKMPTGIEGRTSSKYITMIERPLSTELVLSRRLGATYNWNNDLIGARGGFYSYDDLADDAPKGTGYGARGWITPINTDGKVVHFGLVGNMVEDIDRLRIRARPGAHIVESVEGGGREEFDEFVAPDGSNDPMLSQAAVNGFTDGGRITLYDADEAEYDLYQIEAAGVFGPLHVSAEYMMAEARGTIVGRDGAVAGPGNFVGQELENDLTGWNLTVGYFLTGETRPYKMEEGAFDKVKPKGKSAIELTARIDSIENDDVDGLQTETVAVGANWYLSTNLRFMFNYIAADILDGTDEPDFVTVRASWFF